MKTLNRILFSSFAVAALGTAQIASATDCPGPDANGKRCFLGAPANTPAGGPTVACGAATTPNLTNYRALAGGLCDDDGAIQLGGVSVVWYGVTSTTQCIANNGFMLNKACVAGEFNDFSNDCPLPAAATPHLAVYGVWDDWNCALNPGANVFLDAAVAQPVKARYVDMPLFSDAAARGNFQSTFYNTQDAADVNVISIVDPAAVSLSATIGTENVNSTAGLNEIGCSTTGNAIAGHCQRFAGFTPPPTLQDVINAVAALETKADRNATAVAALETKLDALAGGGTGLAAIEAKLDAIQLMLTPPTTGCTLYNCKK